jgi:DNA-binding MarR family transcriptional regulator
VTAWLTEEEQRAWRGLLHMTAQLNAKMGRQLQDEHGISLPDYDILARLGEVPEGMRVRDLQATLSWGQSRVSHQLSRMERRGLIERRDCPSDRRAATFALTQAGRDAIEQAAPGHVEAVRRMVFDRLTAEDVAHLAAITARVNEHLDRSDEDR